MSMLLDVHLFLSLQSPVDEVFSGLWALMEPVLFGLIGAEIDLKELQLEVVSWGVLIIFSALLVRPSFIIYISM